jgi:hypothetical protein
VKKAASTSLNSNLFIPTQDEKKGKKLTRLLPPSLASSPPLSFIKNNEREDNQVDERERERWKNGGYN